MKKLLILVALAIMVAPFLFGGCSGEAQPTADSEVINADVNKEFVIELDSNPTTGYSWQESYDQTFLTLVEKTYEQSPGSEGMVGSGGTEYFRFKALKAGETKITIGYSRPWESKPPAEIKVFTIIIKPQSETPPPEPIYKDSQQTINTNVGQTFTIGLYIVARLGAKWKVSDYDATMLNLTIPYLYIDDNNPNGPGLGGTEYFQFKALKAGGTKITFIRQNAGRSLEEISFNVDIR